jgi:methionyl-tRNA formyltransferase
MKIVAWVGNQSNQKALVNKIHQQFPLAGIVVEVPVAKRKITFKLLVNAVVEKLFLKRIGQLWWGMLRFYDDKFKHWPDVNTIEVENINSDAAYEFTAALQPDIIIVSGTRLVKKKMIAIAPAIGILNLHTGLSPYIKGGPNCTNWCIATNQFHLIGNTIMWLDAGIDSGNIITTECTDLNADDSLETVHIKVMEHAHDLYCRAIQHLAEGKRNNVLQSTITAGTTYYNKQWNLKNKYRLLKNFKQFKSVLQTDAYKAAKAAVTTVSLKN